MNWNFVTDHYLVRLPISETDSGALFNLLRQQAVCDHIPRTALAIESQATDELRRIALRFETREAAFWLIENEGTGELLARIGIQNINWMMLNAQLQWELSPACDLQVLQEVVPAILEFVFAELRLHRVEMRLRAGNTEHAEYLTALGFEAEGTLPAQFEFNSEDIALDIYSLISDKKF